MTPDRLERIEELYHAALNHPAEKRLEFLTAACGDDLELRHQIESFLIHSESGASLLEKPPWRTPDTVTASGRMCAGVRIGPYEIESFLGSGGMGEVYKARDTRLRRTVALKVLPGYVAGDAASRKRLLREARAASALNHPNIVTIYDVVSEPGQDAIVMEYIEGRNLQEMIGRKPLPLARVMEYGIEIACALAGAHSAGIVHRDLKPHNIMVTDAGHIKILDFGLAKLSAAVTLGHNHYIHTLSTEPGTILGTTQYMSPEQARGLAVDARTDIWSMGCVLYQMLTGYAPFAGETVTDLLLAILEREPPPLDNSGAKAIPEELSSIVEKMLRKEKEERYQTTKELLVDLRRLGEHPFFEARLIESAPQRRRRTAAREEPVTPPRMVASRKLISARRGVVFGSIVAVAISAVAYVWLSKRAFISSQREIRSVAVLPLRPLIAGDNHLGLGIADAVIRRISQTGKVIVRPTSAVRRYLNEDTDALAAAQQLGVDAVLEGMIRRGDDRLRVTVNMLRVSDGASLWAHSFDMRASDIFTIEDTIAEQLTVHLALRLDASQQARLAKRYIPRPRAYDYYTKAVYHFSSRDWNINSREQTDRAIDLFRKAIELDERYALAHAQLGHAYAWTAIVFDDNPVLVERAKQEINTAEKLDPHLPEAHVARSFIAWSQYGQWQVEAAIRQLRLAQEFDPNVGHFELSDIYGHIGLDAEHEKESDLALRIDPTSNIIKQSRVNMYYLRAMPDEALAADRRFFNRGPLTRYYLAKAMLQEAERMLTQEHHSPSGSAQAQADRALLFALQGKHRDAQEAVALMLQKAQEPQQRRAYHHMTYDAARVYALGGRNETAVKWLRETVKEGFPNYSAFMRDSSLNAIRKDSAFIALMAELKAQFERYKREAAE